MTMHRSNLIDGLFIVVIAVLSFLYFGLPFYPYLDSDIGVHVYMTESFSLRSNLYFWHQDRLGSIVPMTGHLFYKVLGLAPVWACALAEYLYLFAGCYAFWYFIAARWQRWLFTVVWFFPTYEMTSLVMPAHPYGEQLAFIAFSLICFDRWLRAYRPVLTLPLFIASAVVAIWISDFSVIFYLVLPFFFLRQLRTSIPMLFKAGQRQTMILSGVVILLGLVMLVFAKTHTPKDDAYIDQLFANRSELIHTLSSLWFYTYNAMSFSSVSWWNSLMFYSTAGALSMVVFMKRWRISLTAWSKYFLVSSLISLLLLISLRWVSINFVMLKYFIPSFVMMWIGLFSVNSELNGRAGYLYALLLFFSVAGAVGSNLHIHHRMEWRTKIDLERLQALRQLRPQAFIGGFWYSYVLGIADPATILATPHEGQFSRNANLLNEVMSRDTVYIVRNDWLDTFPDTLVQYGRTWIKNGNAIRLEPFEMAPYLRQK